MWLLWWSHLNYLNVLKCLCYNLYFADRNYKSKYFYQRKDEDKSDSTFARRQNKWSLRLIEGKGRGQVFANARKHLCSSPPPTPRGEASQHFFQQVLSPEICEYSPTGLSGARTVAQGSQCLCVWWGTAKLRVITLGISDLTSCQSCDYSVICSRNDSGCKKTSR